MGSGVRRIVPLTLGWEDLPLSVSIHGASSADMLREPVPGVLLLCDGGWLLLDTGFNIALIKDPALRRRYHGDPLIQPVLPGPGEPIEEALAGTGIGLDDVPRRGRQPSAQRPRRRPEAVRRAGPRHVQRTELYFGMNGTPAPEQHGIFRVDYDDPRIDWRQADGDAEIAPGVTAVLTAGHTPGHQSFVVDLDASVGGGGIVFAFDAADLTQNIDDELAVGGFIDVEPGETVVQIRKLKRLAAERGYRLVPGHDPVAWPALTRELTTRWPAASR